MTLKCSLPRNFNDPYELFLTVNFREKPEALAFYTDVIGGSSAATGHVLLSITIHSANVGSLRRET